MAPIRGSAREIGERVGMAPGSGGTLWVAIPRAGGSVLALLDRDGRPRPGWPIQVKDSTGCGVPLSVDDGSVRVVCDGTDLPRFDSDASDVRAFAFDDAGRSMAGWPVRLRPGSAVRVVGDQLMVLESQVITDTVTTGQVSWTTRLTTVAADGSIQRGIDTPMNEGCCGGTWVIGPDAVAYGIESVAGGDYAALEVSRILALDRSGARAGWPVRMDGSASAPAFGPDGRTFVTVGSASTGTSRVLAFDRTGKAFSDSSDELRMATVESGVDCIAFVPKAPVVADDGSIFVFSELDTAVIGLRSSLDPMPGWPFKPTTALVRPDPRSEEEGLNCLSLGRPAAGADGTLHLPLQALNATVGGSIVAVATDGRVRPGWPVGLRRPDAEFWTVVVGSDGTAYALAVEPESDGRSSASILAIAPDSTVLFTTTIIEP
jgi:hypothetical protein